MQLVGIWKAKSNRAAQEEAGRRRAMCDEMKNNAKTWRGEVHFITQAGDEAGAVVGEEAGAVVGTSGREGGREGTKDAGQQFVATQKKKWRWK